MRLDSFDAVLQALTQVTDPGLGAPLAHCAQSIEYTLTGFPKPRGLLVRRFFGPRVLRRFLAQGFMTHDLAAPIPGAPVLDPATPLAVGRARLEAAIAAFRAHQGPLAEHFAYGVVSRADTERVQAMHVAEHLG
jgi:hypothetical protein